MKRFFFITALLMIWFSAVAQQNDTIVAVIPDSVSAAAEIAHFEVKTIGDSSIVVMEKKTIKTTRKQMRVVAPDSSLISYEQPVTVFRPVPSRSVWYSLVFPGGGQIYNRRYWKLPIVYTGFTALIYGVSRTGTRYSEYVRGYRDFMDTDPNTKSYENLVPYNYPNSSIESYLSGRVNNFRRYRDLCIVGVVAWYALTVIDAFVDATLADFDVSPDLSMRVGPKVIDNPENHYRPSMGMQVQLCF
ncbi:MAG: DUF5683 domain-containing protein [Paludibacteraceae bacterium]|nr:DUF5683 domain-containing protein [Paludibacteraceae bacterium]